MSIRLSEILEHNAPHLAISNRKRMQTFYDAVVEALRQGELTPEGGALPTTLNTLLALLPGEQRLAARDREMTDWSVENDVKYAAFLDGWRSRMTSVALKVPYVRPIALPYHQAVTHLQRVHASGSKKAELEQAVNLFLDVYALSQHALRLPEVERDIPRQLSEGITVDEQKVALENDVKGRYVGFVKGQRERAV